MCVGERGAWGWAVCWGVRVVVTRQLAVSSHVGPWDLTHVVGLGSKPPYSLSHLDDSRELFLNCRFLGPVSSTKGRPSLGEAPDFQHLYHTCWWMVPAIREAWVPSRWGPWELTGLQPLLQNHAHPFFSLWELRHVAEAFEGPRAAKPFRTKDEVSS